MMNLIIIHTSNKAISGWFSPQIKIAKYRARYNNFKAVVI